MTKLTVAAALTLSGFLFAGQALFAQHDAGKPTQLAVANPGRGSVPSALGYSGKFQFFKITPTDSKVKFDVEASVSIVGTFDKWGRHPDGLLPLTSSTGVLDIKIQADSVDTGSGMKEREAEGKEFLRRQAESGDHVSNQRRLNKPDPTHLQSTATLRFVV